MVHGNRHKLALKLCCFSFLVLCAVLQFRFALHAQREFVGDIVTDSLSLTDPYQLTHLAKEKHLFEADMQSAELLLQKALLANPYFVPAWLGLSELYNDMGRKQKAFRILTYVDKLTSNIKWWRWEKTMVAYQLGKLETIPDELSYIIENIPQNRRNALDLSFSLWPDPEELVKKAGEENIQHLFSFAVQKRDVPKALYFWNLIDKNGEELQPRKVLQLVNMLIGQNELQTAGKIWRENYSSSSSLFNGDFVKPFLGSGFGWRVGRNKSFEYSFERDVELSKKRSVRIRFKGWDNVNFHHLYQIVPLEGGKNYTLSGEIKSYKTTTDQKPFWEVYGHRCSMQRVQTEMVQSNQDWKHYSLNFSVPKECQAIVVRLRRRESNHIDNKLSGKIWIRDMVLSLNK